MLSIIRDEKLFLIPETLHEVETAEQYIKNNPETIIDYSFMFNIFKTVFNAMEDLFKTVKDSNPPAIHPRIKELLDRELEKLHAK